MTRTRIKLLGAALIAGVFLTLPVYRVLAAGSITVTADKDTAAVGDSYVVTVTGANNYFGTVDGAIAVYSITYNYNYDGAAEPYSEYYFVGGTVTRPEDPQRDGYDFVDWYEDVNDDTTVFDFTAPVGRDWVIYATWEEIEQAAGDETPDPDDQNPNPDEGVGSADHVEYAAVRADAFGWDADIDGGDVTYETSWGDDWATWLDLMYYLK